MAISSGVSDAEPSASKPSRGVRYVLRDSLNANYRAEAYVERDYAGTTVCQHLDMPQPTDFNSFSVSRASSAISAGD
jgi:hypothetical protein